MIPDTPQLHTHLRTTSTTFSLVVNPDDVMMYYTIHDSAQWEGDYNIAQSSSKITKNISIHDNYVRDDPQTRKYE